MLRITFSAIMFVISVVLSVFPTIALDDPPRPLIDLFYIDDCSEAPCLFGQPVGDADIWEVMGILEDTPMMEHAMYMYSDIWGEYGSIRWDWDYEINQLLYGFNPSFLNYWYGANAVYLRDGRVESVRFLLNGRLDELISLFGNPVMSYPRSYNRWGDMYVDLEFEAIAGVFSAVIACDDPEFTPNSLIRAYISPAPTRLHPISWQGYTDDLPTCSEIFIP